MFNQLKTKVQERFGLLTAAAMCGDSSGLLVVDLPKNALFDAYIAALPDEEKQPHTCNCCRSFLNHYGNVVALIDSKVATLWEFDAPAPYENVPAALDAVIRAAAITDPFVTHNQKLGTDFNYDHSNGEAILWEHFYYSLPKSFTTPRSVSEDTVRGQYRTQQQVFERALLEIPLDATDTVLELIAQNSLYRGAEHKPALDKFRKYQVAVVGKSSEAIGLYAWAHFRFAPPIRNTSIGTLLVDLAEGRPLDAAVASYEQKVAPANYRRPTALVTKGMLEQAEKTLVDLGLDKALYRRHATIDDIPVHEALFVHRAAAAPSLFDAMKADVIVDPRTFSKVETVPVERFIADVLPTATAIEVLFENSQVGNLVNLTAPQDADAPNLFSWSNGMAWAYKDGVADSVKERVKRAGGRVEGVLRISLDWNNYDDLDLHVVEPSGNKIYFRNKTSGRTGGQLDVDMNAGGGTTREPVENVIYQSEHLLAEGTYLAYVNQYQLRERTGTGYGVEVECGGEVVAVSTDVNPRQGETVAVFEIRYSKARGFTVVPQPGFKSRNPKTQEVYGIQTNRFHPVTAIIPSPNYWDGAAKGNKHTLFVIENARTDTPIRGFFNEFLKPELNAHRKVFELLGEKVKIAPEGPQVAGLGFSSTQRAEVVCRVIGKVNRVIKIQF